MTIAASTAVIAQSGSSQWLSQDIGGPAISGSVTESGGTFTITAGGADIYGRRDQFFFVFQKIDGDLDIRARVDALTRASSGSKAGVMIRSSLASNAANAYVYVTPSGSTAFQRRRRDGARTSRVSGPSASMPEWVRLVRAGTTLSSYVSSDGTNWQPVGQSTITIGTSAYVGLAVTSRNTSVATTATISQVNLQTLGLPAGQADADIGQPAVAGSAAYSAGTYTVSGAGSGIGGTSDQFYYVYQQVSGDVDVSLHVQSLTAVSGSSKAGVMIRESLDPSAPHATAVVTAGNGYLFQRRTAAGGDTTQTDGGSGTAPGWVRVQRAGSMVTAYRSTDGVSWSVIGSDAVSMSDTVYVGIAVSSESAAAATTAMADHFAVSLQAATNQPPTVALTTPSDGQTFDAPATVNLTASAADPENRLAQVDFYSGSTLLGSATASPYAFTWSSVAAGTYSLTAVARDADGASTTSTPVSITVNAANAAPSVTMTAPANNSTFTAPATITVSADASDPENSLAKVEFYNGSTLLGSDTSAPYAFSWSNVAAGTYTLTAKAYDTAGATATSGPVTITVSAPNQPPTVTLTSPANNATFTAPATVNVAANATDSDGTVAKVEFYNGATLLGSDTAAPYAFSWSNVAAGTYTLTAKAYDAAGASATSGPITITVSAPNQPPTVTLTSPANNASYTEPADIGLAASAVDADGTVARVEFYSGTTLLGSDSSAPYAFTWSSVPAGTYTLLAKAYDNAGAVTSSTAVTVTVTAVTAVPTGVIFQASADHATVVSYRLDVFAAGADPNTATPIASYDAGKPTPDANNDITVSAPSFFSALAPGSYQLTVSAINDGGIGRSAAIAFTR